MKKTLYSLFSILLLASTNLNAEESNLFNVLSIPNGAYIVKAPTSFTKASETSNKIKNWTKEGIIDGTTYKGWNSYEEEALPMEFIFELSEECVIEKFGFNTECEREYKGICAKNIKVEVSIKGKNEGFKEVLTEKLEEYAPTKYFPITPTNARWIKVTILSNYGNKKHTELMEIEAMGKYANEEVKTINLTGDWTSTWGTVSIRQNGSSIKGCYQYRNGKITNAGMDRRILSFKWEEEGENGSGLAVLVVNEDGTRLNGIWSFGDDLKKYGLWTFKRKADTPTLCYQIDESQKKDEEKQNQLKKEIESTGKLTIYGINFELGSATIKEESYPTLDDIFNMLNDNAEMKLTINGHTDSQGSADYNKKLSTNRAESVKKYLVEKGIATERLEAFGKGEEEPVADNSTQLGRAANRRVELKLKK